MLLEAAVPQMTDRITVLCWRFREPRGLTYLRLQQRQQVHKNAAGHEGVVASLVRELPLSHRDVLLKSWGMLHSGQGCCWVQAC